VQLHPRWCLNRRQNVAGLLEAMVEDHERATGPWRIEMGRHPGAFPAQLGCPRPCAGDRWRTARRGR
jgi:hypothetical protein